MTRNPRHVSYEQIKAVVEFMGRHVDLASGSLRTLQDRHLNRKLWNELSNIVNNMQSGTKKTADGWRKYWNDFKNKLKRKVILINRKYSSYRPNLKPLNKLERQILEILGPDFAKAGYHSGKHRAINHRLPKVKLEEHNFDMGGNVNESSDKLSDSEKNESEAGESDDEVSETDNNRMQLQNIYPKWLIEIEKKRTDIELRRAKAEEKQADIAAQNAETARNQVEALRKLTDAVSTQAEAMLRIASVLESKIHPIEDALAL
ncbi:uncharacterized protein LOC125063633 [Pieris napi]|uniref:uncharacterized protein LOC125063633 n=1 Tax=Pieris napi TaxID=78633 RepID=UPI001FBBF877|nr:uncharacterized protein LOC125063633 [Pieris napi]